MGVGDVAVCIGTDDEVVADLLRPWVVFEHAELVDFALELHPAAPRNRAAPRALPNLRHGTEYLVRGHDPSMLTDGLLRILAEFERPTPLGAIRLRGQPLLRDGTIVLLPPRRLTLLPLRWLEQRNLQPIVAESVVVDSESLTVTVDAPLGSTQPALAAPLGHWWLAHRDPSRGYSPAEIVALALPRARAMANSLRLEAIVRLVDQLPPGAMGFDAATLRAGLDALDR